MNEKKLRQLVEEHRRTVAAPAMEGLEHVYRSLLAMPSFTLAGGMTATIRPYFPPLIDDADDAVKCGFDLVLGDGTSLEFTVGNTGWGKALIKDASSKRRGKSWER